MKLVLILIAGFGGSVFAAELPFEVPEFSTRGMPAEVSSYFQYSLEDIRQKGVAAVGSGRAAAYGELGQLFLAYSLDAQAEQCLQKASLLQPEQAAWAYLRGVVASRAGSSENAISFFLQALAAQPDYYPARIKLAEIFRDLGRFNDADRVLSRLPQGPGAGAAINAALGEHWLATGRPALALEVLSLALSVEAKANRLHYMLGQAHRSLKNRDQARFHFKRAGDIGLAVPDPYMTSVVDLGQSEVLMIQTGHRAFKAGDYAGAVRAFEDALEFAPDSVRAKINLASALAEGGHPVNAKTLFQEVLRAVPDHGVALYNLARLEASAGKLEQASEFFSQLLQLTPDDIVAVWEHAKVLRALGEADASLNKLAKLKGHPGYFRRAVLLEAEILLQHGRIANALDNLEHAIEIMPRDVEIVSTLANLLSIAPGNMRNPARALELARRAFEQSPGSATAESVGLALSASSRCSQAIIWLGRAVQLTGDAPEQARLRQIAAEIDAKGICIP